MNEEKIGEVGSRAVPFEMPKYAKRILSHYTYCFSIKRCILCSDCLAYALYLIKDIDSPQDVLFSKFLKSTLSGIHNPCPRAKKIKKEEVSQLANFLLKLSKEKRKVLRKNLFCHDEFK